MKRGERFVRSTRHRVVKLPISPDLTYYDLLAKLKAKFEINAATRCTLVDSSDAEISAESYNLPRIIANKQYVGLTRLYLCVDDETFAESQVLQLGIVFSCPSVFLCNFY